MEYFAVLDTETNWNNEVMSIGIVIADKKTYEKEDALYFVFDPECRVGGLFSTQLPLEGYNNQDLTISRKKAMMIVKSLLDKYNVRQVFAYNASFDKNLLGELSSYQWFDIMRIAAYKQYNDKIPSCVECCKTGKMKRSYGVEPMMQMLSGDDTYLEIHNALCDAIDELEIMNLLGKSLDVYDAARI